MIAKFITPVVIAALLLTGTAAALPERAEPEQIKTAISTEATQTPTAPAAAALTAQEAQSIALAHAGLTVEEVTRLHAEPDRERGTLTWEVEFRLGDWEYDYRIHAETGEVLHWDKEFDPLREQPAQPPATEPAPTQSGSITKEEAVAIALAHARLTADQVWEMEAEFDMECSGPEWEVEFTADGWEYEYEIDAATGQILRSEKEWDD